MIHQDISHWPLVLVTFDGTPATEANIDTFIEEQRAMLARREPFVEICDARYARAIPATQRKRMADWLSESSELAGRYCAACAVMIESDIIRGAMNAVMWLKKPSFPTKVVSGPAEAVRYCRERMAEDGRSIPADVSLNGWLAQAGSRRTRL